MTQEIWKPIKGFECYEISNKGNVRSLDRIVNCVRNGKIVGLKWKGQMMKPTPNYKGYLKITLFKDGKRGNFSIHRLVADAFIGDTTGKEIDHINTIRTDNRVENLKIVTSKENNNNPITKERKASKRRKRVRCITQDGNIIEFDSIVEAAKSVYGYREDSISLCCSGKYQTHNNNRWEYIN